MTPLPRELPLAPFQKRLVYLVCEEGLLYREVAAKLRMNPNVIKVYMSAIHKALDTHSLTQLTARYWKRKIEFDL